MSPKTAVVHKARPTPGARHDEAARQAWGSLVALMLSMRSRWVEAAAALDLTTAQATALRHLSPGTLVPMSALAEALLCDASNVTGIVDKMEARGLIERRADPHDRRVKMLAVTEVGIKLREKLLENIAQPPEVMQRLSLDELGALANLIEKLSG